MKTVTLMHDPYYGGKVKVGDKVMLVTYLNCLTGKEWNEVIVRDDGVPGNMDGHIKRYHGWRGTTQNVSMTAHGLREVLSVEDVIVRDWWEKQRVTVGEDLHPDWE